MVALDPLFRYSTVTQSNSHQKKNSNKHLVPLLCLLFFFLHTLHKMLVQLVRRPIAWRPLLYPTSQLRFYSTDLEKLKKESDTTESDNSASTTGVIDKKHSEVLLYYDHIYPFTVSHNRLAQYLSRFTFPWARKFDDEKLKQKVWNLSTPLPAGSTITEFVSLRETLESLSSSATRLMWRPRSSLRRFARTYATMMRKEAMLMLYLVC